MPVPETMWTLLGLGPDDERVYRAMLGDPGGTVLRWADLAGVTTERVEVAIDRLVGLQLARHVDDRFEVMEPRAALTALARRRQAVLDHVTDVAHDLGVTFGAARVRAESEPLYEVLRGRDEVVHRHIELVNAATTSICVASTPPFLTGNNTDTDAAVHAALDRRVRIRVVYDTAALAIPELYGVMTAMAARGEATRVVPRVVTRFVIIDGGTTLLPVVGDSVGGHPEPRALVVATSALTDIVQALFERYWDAGTDMRAGLPVAESEGVDLDDQALLDLLANGLPDAAIAHQLGCSERTLRRRITRLADVLDASSRFQLGVLARDRGWV